MGTDPEQLRREIEDTRRELTYDVDALNEKVNPGRVVERRVNRTKTAATGLKDRIMGSAHDTVATVQDKVHSSSGSSDGPGMGDRLASARDSAAGAGQGVAQQAQGMAHQAQDRTQDLAHQAKARAEGNPLAAGLIAFGVGWLVSSLLPASQKEQQAASRLTDAAKGAAGPLKEQAMQVAHQIKDDMQPAAQHAAASVLKETVSHAAQAATAVKDEGKAAVQDVKGDAKQGAQQTQQAARQGG